MLNVWFFFVKITINFNNTLQKNAQKTRICVGMENALEKIH